MSYKAEFKVDGKWYDNAIRIADKTQCEQYGHDKFQSCTMPSDFRIVRSADMPNYRYIQRQLESI
jgi:hypothetical protein